MDYNIFEKILTNNKIEIIDKNKLSLQDKNKLVINFIECIKQDIELCNLEEIKIINKIDFVVVCRNKEFMKSFRSLDMEKTIFNICLGYSILKNENLKKVIEKIVGNNFYLNLEEFKYFI